MVAVITAAGLLSGVWRSPATHPVAASASVSVSAKGTSAVSGKPAPRRVTAPSPGYPPNLEAGITGFFLPATGAQYTTGALFTGEYRALQGKITSLCMVRLRFPAQPVPSPADIAQVFFDLSQFPDLSAIAKAGTLPSYSSGPTPPESKAFQNAYAHCATVAQNVFTPMVNAGFSFGGPFAATVSSIQASAPVMATLPALRACATRFGWPNSPYGPTRPINSFSDFVDWIAGHIDGADSRGASTAEMNALNRRWANAFVQCARPTVTVMERLQLAAQERFLAGHQRQFAALVKLARASFARARRLARG